MKCKSKRRLLNKKPIVGAPRWVPNFFTDLQERAAARPYMFFITKQEQLIKQLPKNFPSFISGAHLVWHYIGKEKKQPMAKT